MDVIGPQLAAHASAIVVCGAMQVLIATAAPNGLHIRHPEVIGIGTHDMHGLTKAKLDLEAIAVKREYLQRLKRQVGTQQKEL